MCAMCTARGMQWPHGGHRLACERGCVPSRHNLSPSHLPPLTLSPTALSVDVIDTSGTADSDVNYARGARLRKVRLSAAGAPLGEYATPQSQRAVQQGMSTVVNVDLGAAMQQMGEMEEEIGAHEGCRLSGDVTVRRVAGRLHFAVHQQSFVDLLPQMLTGHALPKLRNMSHTIHGVSFGPRFPGQVNPLDGTARVEAPGGGGHAWKYFIKVRAESVECVECTV